MTATRPMIDVHVRGIEAEVWRAIRLEAVTRGLSVAGLLDVIWHDWAKDHSIVLFKQQQHD